MFVSSATGQPFTSGGSSAVTTVYVVTHGSESNFDSYFSAVYPQVSGSKSLLIAPGFYDTSAAVSSSSWYRPGQNLDWAPGMAWKQGDAAIGTSCSSYALYDTLLQSFNDRAKYPNLSRVIFIGHSRGATFTSDYALTSNAIDSSRVPVSFVIANPPDMAYPTSARAWLGQYNSTNCNAYQSWSYGYNSANSYASSKFSASGGNLATFKKWISRDIVMMVGDYDTYSRYPSGDQSCSALAQGGQNRRDRNYAWYAYTNMLVGTGRDVSSFYGNVHLRPLTSSAAKGASYNLKYCIVPKVGHVATDMFNSACGRAAIGRTYLPALSGTPARP